MQQHVSSIHDSQNTLWGRQLCQVFMQELMNRHGEKEQLTSVTILCQITLQNAPYKDYKLLVLMSFEVTTVTTQEPPPATDDGHLLAS